MSEKFDTGGPAFPDPAAAHPGASPPDNNKGMTLRDHFAGLAMQSYIAGCMAKETWPAPEEVSKEAFLYADAMIAERKRRMEGKS